MIEEKKREFNVEKKEGEDKTVKFNIGEKQLEIIGSLIASASVKQINGDKAGRFADLKSIKLKIIYTLNKNLREELSKKEKLIGYLLNKINNSPMCDMDEMIIKRNRSIDCLLDNHLEVYETRLMELLDEREFLVPAKEKATNLFGQDEDEK